MPQRPAACGNTPHAAPCRGAQHRSSRFGRGSKALDALILFFFVWLIAPCFTAMIAYEYGHSFFKWFVFAAFAPIVAHVVLYRKLPPTPPRERRPWHIGE